MKKLICFTAILGLFACSQPPTGLNPKNQIAANVSVYDPGDIRNFVLNQQLTRAQVQESINSLKASFKASYIGYEVKKQLAGISGDEVFANCNTMIPQKEGFAAFEYYDIIYKCLAQFKDSHISLRRSMYPAFVSTAIAETMLVEDKIIITLVRSNVIKKFEEMQSLPEGTLASSLKRGTEILSINGTDAKTAMKELEPFISASSDSARKNDAVERFFLRTINYPKSKDLNLKLKLADGSEKDVTIPWLFIISNASLESKVMLTDAGIVGFDTLNKERSFLGMSGFFRGEPLFSDLANQKIYLDEDDNDFLITGIKNDNGRNVCYMQLKSFSIDETEGFGYKVFTKINNVKNPVNFFTEVRSFLSTCDAYGSPLVLDMRENGGGDAYFAEAFFLLFEKADTPANYSARAYNLQNGNYSYLGNVFNDVDRESLPMLQSLVFKSASESAARKQNISDWVLIRPKATEPVFSGPVSVVISQNCVSACENTSNRFKVTGRGRILGTHSAGTGFGFSSNSAKTTYRDSLNLLEVNILNMAFQTGVVSDDQDFVTDDKSKGGIRPLSQITFLENNPVQPDVPLDYTVKDLSGEFADYGAAVLRSFASPPVVANTQPH